MVLLMNGLCFCVNTHVVELNAFLLYLVSMQCFSAFRQLLVDSYSICLVCNSFTTFRFESILPEDTCRDTFNLNA